MLSPPAEVRHGVVPNEVVCPWSALDDENGGLRQSQTYEISIIAKLLTLIYRITEGFCK